MDDSYKTEAEVTKCLQEFEVKNHVLDIAYQGWSVWQVLRFPVSRILQNLPYDNAELKPIPRRALIRQAGRDFLRFIIARKTDVIARSFNRSRRDEIGGKKVDIYLDRVLEACSSFVKIESIYPTDYNSDTANHLFPRQISTTFFDVLSDKIASLIPNRELAKCARQICDMLTDEGVLESTQCSYLSHILQVAFWKKRLLKSLFKRMSPSCMMISTINDFPFVAACNELGIKVIEFQHGILHRDFPGSSWTEAAVPYKGQMAMPNAICLYGDYWKAEQKYYGFWKEELQVVGFPHLSYYETKGIQANKTTTDVVFTTQGIDTEKVIGYFQELLDILCDIENLRIHFKMHPTYQKSENRYREAFQSDPRVVLHSGESATSIYRLLSHADYHASIYSTCHYEAIAFSVPTIIIPFTGAENVAHLASAGAAHIMERPEDFAKFIREPKTSSLERAQASHESWFTPDSMRNLDRVLDMLEIPVRPESH